MLLCGARGLRGDGQLVRIADFSGVKRTEWHEHVIGTQGGKVTFEENMVDLFMMQIEWLYRYKNHLRLSIILL